MRALPFAISHGSTAVRLDFHQNAGSAQRQHLQHGDDGRVGRLAGEFLPGLKAGHDVEVAGDVDRDLDEVFDVGARRLEAQLQVVESLGGLGAEIALDELAAPCRPSSGHRS